MQKKALNFFLHLIYYGTIDILSKGAMCMWIYCRYITKNGVRIYPKNKRYFRFWVDDEKAVKKGNTDKQ